MLAAVQQHLLAHLRALAYHRRANTANNERTDRAHRLPPSVSIEHAGADAAHGDHDRAALNPCVSRCTRRAARALLSLLRPSPGAR